MEAIARVRDNNDLTNGESQFRPTVFLPERFKRLHNGEQIEVVMQDEYGNPVSLEIKGIRKFNLENPIEKRQWNVLNAMLKLSGMEELAEMIELIDPDKDDTEAMKRERKEMELRQIILEHENDQEWLVKVYRRVIGPALGINVKTLARTLLERAKFSDPAKKEYGINQFIAEGKWVFEDEYFETRSLLGLAVEKGAIVKDGTEYRLPGPNGKIFAKDDMQALYALQSDPTLRAFIESRVSGKVMPEPDTIPQIANPELAALLDEIGTPVKVTRKAATKEESTDKKADELINKLDLAGLLIHEEGSPVIKVQDIEQEFKSRDEFKKTLVKNPALMNQLNQLI